MYQQTKSSRLPLLSRLSLDNQRELFRLLSVRGQNLCLKANTVTRLLTQQGLVHLDVSAVEEPGERDRLPGDMNALIKEDPSQLAAIFPNLEKITMIRPPFEVLENITYDLPMGFAELKEVESWNGGYLTVEQFPWPSNLLARALSQLTHLHFLVVPAPCFACLEDISLLNLTSLVLTDLPFNYYYTTELWRGKLPLMPKLKHLQRLFDSKRSIHYQNDSFKPGVDQALYVSSDVNRLLSSIETLVWIGIGSLKPEWLQSCTRLILIPEHPETHGGPFEPFLESQWEKFELLPHLKELTFVDFRNYLGGPQVNRPTYTFKLLNDKKRTKILLNNFMNYYNEEEGSTLSTSTGITFLNRERHPRILGNTTTLWLDIMLENRGMLKTLVLIPQETSSMLKEPKLTPLRKGESIVLLPKTEGVITHLLFSLTFDQLQSLTLTTGSLLFTPSTYDGTVPGQMLELDLPRLKYLNVTVDVYKTPGLKGVRKTREKSITLQAPGLKHLVISSVPHEDTYKPTSHLIFYEWLVYFLTECRELVTVGINLRRDDRIELFNSLRRPEGDNEKLDLPSTVEILGFGCWYNWFGTADSISRNGDLKLEQLKEHVDELFTSKRLRNVVLCKHIRMANHVSFDENGEDAEPLIFYTSELRLSDVYSAPPQHYIAKAADFTKIVPF